MTFRLFGNSLGATDIPQLLPSAVTDDVHIGPFLLLACCRTSNPVTKVLHCWIGKPPRLHMRQPHREGVIVQLQNGFHGTNQNTTRDKAKEELIFEKENGSLKGICLAERTR